MLKRVFALMMMVCVLATMCIAPVVEAVDSGNLISVSVTDECADFSNIWSQKNIVQTPEDTLALQKPGYGDTSVWWLENMNNTAEIVYRTSEGKVFSGAYIQVSTAKQIIFPTISYSTDGINYKDVLNTESKSPAYTQEGWAKKDIGYSGENTAYQVVSDVQLEIPGNATYLKISVVDAKAGNRASQDHLMFRQIKLDVTDKVGEGLISEDCTDDFTTLNKAYSITNFEKIGAYKLGSGVISSTKTFNGIEDTEAVAINTLAPKDKSQEAEIVYRAADNTYFTSIKARILRDGWIKFPEIEYRSTLDGEWTTLCNESPDAQDWNGWFKAQAGSDSNAWVFIYNNTTTAINLAKEIKITFPANSYTIPRIVDLTFVVENITAPTGSVIEDIANFQNVPAYRLSTGMISTTKTINGTEDTGAVAINTLAPKEKSQEAEIVYRAADNTYFTSIKANILRNGWIRFPEIAYRSTLDGEWTTLCNASTTDIQDETGWVKNQNGADSNAWAYIYYNTKTDINLAKEIKITFPANSHTIPRIVDLKFEAITAPNGSVIEDISNLQNVPAYRLSNGMISTTKTISGTEDTEAVEINTLAPKEKSQEAEIVYRAADNTYFTSIEANILRTGWIKFPKIEYRSTLDGEWTTLCNESADTQDWDGWFKAQGGSDSNAWAYIYYNTKTDINLAKEIKITFPANSHTIPRIVDVAFTTEREFAVSAEGNASLIIESVPAGTKLFIAEYNSDDRLVNVDVYDVTLANYRFTQTLAPTAVGTYFKAFLFDGMETIRPIIPSASSKN